MSNYTPSLDECLQRAGWKDKIVSHTAVEDAKDVLRALRAHWAKQQSQEALLKTAFTMQNLAQENLAV